MRKPIQLLNRGTLTPAFITKYGSVVTIEEIRDLLSEHKDMNGKPIRTQLKAIGWLKAFDEGSSPWQLPLSFSEALTGDST